MGGLGNNLFQLANVYNIHKLRNIPYFIDRGFERLTFDGKLLKDDSRFNQSHIFEIPILFDNKFVYKDEVEYDFKNMTNYYHEDLKSTSNFKYVKPNLQSNIIHNGYYQSFKYFSDFDIKREFVLNHDIIKKIKEKYSAVFTRPTISLHYRLGGDRKISRIQKYHKNVSPKFYSKGLKIIANKTNRDIKDFNILLFSDDLELAKRALKIYSIDAIPIKNTDNVEDFIHMSMCDHNIIGNSTYGWWASFFNKKEEKIQVVTKSEFFGPRYENFALEDLFPEDWIKL
jgi:hypothetical protein